MKEKHGSEELASRLMHVVSNTENICPYIQLPHASLTQYPEIINHHTDALFTVHSVLFLTTGLKYVARSSHV